MFLRGGPRADWFRDYKSTTCVLPVRGRGIQGSCGNEHLWRMQSGNIFPGWGVSVH